MAKLLEKNGAEMASALVALATPIRNYMEDVEFSEALKECTRKGVTNKATDILTIYTELIPHLFGEKHLKDTLQILAIIEGTTVQKMLKMNGTDLMADALSAWNEQIKPFFMRLGLSA